MTAHPSTQSNRTRVRRPSVLAWLRLVHVCHKIDRRSEDQMRCAGLSVAQFDVLARVGTDPGLTQQDLANSLLVTKGNVCQLLDRMEAADLIERRQEGRTNRLFLTERGRDLYEQVLPVHEDLIADQFASLSSEEQRELLDLLRRLDRSLP